MQVAEVFKKQFVLLDGGRRWFISDFITFQYGELNANNPAHKGAIKELKRYSLLSSDLSIVLPQNNLKGATEELHSTSLGAKDKDKAKDTATAKDMGKEKEKATGSVNSLVGSLCEAVDPNPNHDIELLLFQSWGYAGRGLGNLTMIAFAGLKKTFGWEKLKYAVEESARHNKKSLAYVQAILDPSVRDQSDKRRKEEEYQKYLKAKGGSA